MEPKKNDFGKYNGVKFATYISNKDALFAEFCIHNYHNKIQAPSFGATLEKLAESAQSSGVKNRDNLKSILNYAIFLTHQGEFNRALAAFKTIDITNDVIAYRYYARLMLAMGNLHNLEYCFESVLTCCMNSQVDVLYTKKIETSISLADLGALFIAKSYVASDSIGLAYLQGIEFYVRALHALPVLTDSVPSSVKLCVMATMADQMNALGVALLHSQNGSGFASNLFETLVSKIIPRFGEILVRLNATAHMNLGTAYRNMHQQYPSSVQYKSKAVECVAMSLVIQTTIGESVIQTVDLNERNQSKISIPSQYFQSLETLGTRIFAQSNSPWSIDDLTLQFGSIL